MEVIKSPNLNILTKAHENKWVALSSDYQKVVGVADTLREVREKAKERDVVVMRVLPSELGYPSHVT